MNSVQEAGCFYIIHSVSNDPPESSGTHNGRGRSSMARPMKIRSRENEKLQSCKGTKE